MQRRFLALLIILLPVPTARAQWYVWTDVNGTVQVTNQLAEKPAAPNGLAVVDTGPSSQPHASVAATSPTPTPTPAEALHPRLDELRRRERRLENHRAHLSLLSQVAGERSPHQLRLENELTDEIRSEEARIDDLRRGLDDEKVAQ